MTVSNGCCLQLGEAKAELYQELRKAERVHARGGVHDKFALELARQRFRRLRDQCEHR